MLPPHLVQFDKAVKDRKESTAAFVDYWRDHAIYSTLEFWIMLAILIVPLIFLFFKIDKSKIFLIGFYGYSVHIIFAYIDIFGLNSGLWNYPFQLIPALPSLSIDSSIVPVAFMLTYQWTLKHNKNYYLYTGIIAAVFSFAFKPMLVELDLFRMYGKINYIYLFICYLVVLFLAKMVTNIFLWMQKKFAKSTEIVKS